MAENRFAALLEELHPRERVALARARSTLRRGARAASVAVRYRVPGAVPHIKQKSSAVCWATVATMLMSWHDRMSMDPEAAMARLGQEYADLYGANKGLPTARKAAFLAAIGLQAEPPMSWPIEGWEQLLREYGPLWVTTDEHPTDALVHGRVIVGMEGDGSPGGTMVHVLDPLKDGPTQESYESFLKKYHAVVKPIGPLMIQVVHYPQDAGRATQQSYSFAAPAAAAGGAAAIGLVGPTYEVLKDIVRSMSTDITYRTEHLKGKVHPWDNVSYDSKGAWSEATIRVREGVLPIAARRIPVVRGILGEEQSLEFDVNYWYNGHSVGSISVSPARYEDAATWSLFVEQMIKPLPGAFSVNGKPVAGVRLEFVYTHTRGTGKVRIHRYELTLYGSGTRFEKGRWTQ